MNLLSGYKPAWAWAELAAVLVDVAAVHIKERVSSHHLIC